MSLDGDYVDSVLYVRVCKGGFTLLLMMSINIKIESKAISSCMLIKVTKERHR